MNLPLFFLTSCITGSPTHVWTSSSCHSYSLNQLICELKDNQFPTIKSNSSLVFKLFLVPGSYMSRLSFSLMSVNRTIWVLDCCPGNIVNVKLYLWLWDIVISCFSHSGSLCSDTRVHVHKRGSFVSCLISFDMLWGHVCIMLFQCLAEQQFVTGAVFIQFLDFFLLQRIF